MNALNKQMSSGFNQLNFNLDDFIDHKVLENLLQNNKTLENKVKNDLNSLTYRNLIAFYNPKLNLKSVLTLEKEVEENILLLLNNINFPNADYEGTYLQNLSSCLTLKYMLSLIEKTKLEIQNKITKFAQDINNSNSNRYKYNDNVKKNMKDLFSSLINADEEDYINSLKNKARPETACPSNLRLNNSNVRGSSVVGGSYNFYDEGKENLKLNLLKFRNFYEFFR